MDAPPAAPAAVRAIGARPIVAAFLIALVAYVVVASAARAVQRPFWFDEIYTVAIADEGSPARVWSALADAADGQPPLFYLLHASVRGVTADPHLGFRLVSIAAFPLTAIALFTFVRYRANAVAGATAVFFLLLTPMFAVYSVEARPYSPAVACIAWAMVAYQRADRAGPAAALGLLLALATSLHYFAVLAIVPFGVAELARTTRLRDARPRIWMALVVGALPLAAFWPLLQHVKRVYGDHFWSPPRLSRMLTSHDALLGLPDWWGAALAVALSAILAGRAVILLKADRDKAERDEPNLRAELVLVMSLIHLPLIGTVVAKVTHGGFTPRYTIPAVLGVAAGLAMTTVLPPRLGGRWRNAVLCLGLVLVFGLREIEYWRDRRPATAITPEAAELRSLLAGAGRADLPLVVSHGMKFVELWYYKASAGLPRFWYLGDRDAARRHAASDSVDIGLERLAHIRQVDLQPRAEFMRAHPEFLIYSTPDRFDWLHDALVRDGWRVRPMAVSRSGSRILYLAGSPALDGKAAGAAVR